MKKSQVLAALALAFALGLGVVAPVANTYAQVVAPADQATAEKLNKDLAKAIEEAQKIDGYQEYSALVDVINDINEAVEAKEKALAPILLQKLSGVTTVVVNNAVDYKGDALTASASSTTTQADDGVVTTGTTATITFNVVSKNAAEDYAALMQAAINRQATLTSEVQKYNGYTDAQYDQMNATQKAALQNTRNKLTAINSVVEDCQSQIGAAIGTDNVTALDNALKGALSEKAYNDFKASDAWKDANTNIKRVDALVAAAKGDKDYAYFNRLINAVEEAEKIATTGSYGIEAGNKALAELNNAIKGTTSAGNTGDGTNKPEEGGNKAPNTGILADAEGNASTTVAMVAGIATALTAAGAGVVAYRNARRSTRK